MNNPQQIRNIAESSYRQASPATAAYQTGIQNGVELKHKSEEYGYDADGNLLYVNRGIQTSDSTMQVNHSRKMLWDEENRLQAVSDNGFVSNYYYDASGERTVKLSGASQGVYYKLTSLTATVKARYDSLGVAYHGSPQGMNGFETSAAGKINTPQLYFYHPDHLGSSSLITENNGLLVQHLQYLPFGEVFIDERKGSWHTPFTFSAKEQDEETGLHFFGARYYDSRTSAWLSVDPLAEKYPNFSSYVYCYENPLNVTDPDGREGIGETVKKAYEQASTWAANNPQVTARVDGALKLAGGLVEGVIGLAASCAGVPAGPAAVAHGSDVGGTGINQLISGQFQNTAISGALQNAGVSAGVADAIDAGVGAALTAGASIGLNGVKSTSVATASSINNPVPKTLARVIPADIKSSTLGASNASDVFVTGASDIKGLNASQIANRLTIPQSKSGFKIIMFDTPSNGLSTPINRTNPGFVGFGKTAGGAREFTIPNQSIPSGAKIKIVK